MKKILLPMTFVFALIILLSNTTYNSKVTNQWPSLTNEEVGKGLKEALSIGTDSAVKNLMKANGFYKDAAVKILLPKEAADLIKYKNKVPGLAPIVNELELRMNRAAEDAVKEAVPIFKSAILGIGFTDAVSILKGNNNAATLYLKSKTEQQLISAFSPKIKASLDKPLVPSVSANDSWKSATTIWNKFTKTPAAKFLNVKPVNVDLTNYVTTLAVKAVFTKIEAQESNIRSKTSYQVNDLLSKIFSNK